MERRKEMRIIAFKSLYSSDHSLVISNKSLQSGFKPEGNYMIQMQISKPLTKQQIISLPANISCNNLHRIVLLSNEVKFIRFKTNLLYFPPVCLSFFLFILHQSAEG